YLLALLNGLSIANHMWAILPLACYMVFVALLLKRRTIGLRELLICAALWVVGALPYIYIIIDEMLRTGQIGATLASAAFGKRWAGQVLNVSLTGRMALENIAFIILNFPTPNIALLFVGLFAIWKLSPRSFVAIAFASMVLFFGFAFRYTVPDRHAFFFPFYICAVLCIGAGVNHLDLKYGRRSLRLAVLLLAFLPVGVYFVTPAIGRHVHPSLAERRQVPYRDDYDYWLQPWQIGYRGGEQFAVAALHQVEKNAVIYADSTTGFTLLYIHQTHGIRPDVRIITSHYIPDEPLSFTEEAIGELLDTSAVYVVSAIPGYCPPFILEKYDVVKEGVLYRVVRRPDD
ncbi:MAG TPA: hypothetical protein VLH60_06260, partial [Sedimentisphaerales bacterium]|nr:hypothetical protein [Sedimentisphaerales bacterium]